MSPRRPSGMRGYTVLWAGQVMSVSGARMVAFAFGIWLFQRTHSTVDLAAMTMTAFVATMACSPFAGAAIDRLPRRLTIVASDAGSGVVLLVLAILFATGGVEVWQLYAANAVIGAFVAFQGPAYSATIAVMVDEKHYVRANAMRSMAESIPSILAPASGAAVLQLVGIEGVVLGALAASLVAVGTAFCAAIPDAGDRGAARRQGLWSGAWSGFRYIAGRRGLLGIQLTFFAISLISAMGWQVLTPMVLLRTGDDEVAAGLVQTVGAVGGVVGGLVMTALPSPARRIRGALAAIIVYMLLGRLVLGVGDGPLWWAAGWFSAWLCMPFLRGYLDAIWQRKVDTGMQGRVFGARQFLDNLSLPIALGAVGPLVDRVLEPGMREGGALAAVFGGLVTPGPGGGMALVFLGTGAVGTLVGVAAFLVPAIRDVDTDLPDHDHRTPSTTEELVQA
ncbi:MFS transporter [Longispora fulva]|uniref:MFS family permease n=1 Tax=Longispora fulva TaxID=619741 RepID=A0A8J7GFS0_9ACTN|nr:MFS transporter [Longispora fulva]MBG6135757.1 MFS family permease [Longispora fulva]GIG56002.1 MFS transporter [Longispora fulva]